MAWLFLGAVLGVIGTLAACAAIDVARKRSGGSRTDDGTPTPPPTGSG